MWPTEPAKAGWSFNKWQISIIPKERRQRRLVMRLRCRSGREWAAAPAAAVEREGVVAVAAVPAAGGGAVARAAALAVVAVPRVVRAVAGGHVARVAVDPAADAVAMENRVIAMVDAATAAASSSRT